VPRGISHLAAAVALVVVALALGRVASAQPAPRSDREAQIAAAVAHFDRGRALMQAKKYAEACEAFAQSQKLDPGWGTLYNLARCQELDGKLASALALFRELARPDSYPAQPGEVSPDRDRARRKDAGLRASALDKRVPRLRLTASDSPAGLAVTLDGVDVTSRLGTDHPVDPGTHKIHATATARKPFDSTTEIRVDARTTTIVLELAPADEPPPVVTPPTEPHPTPTDRGSRDVPVPPSAPESRPTDSHPSDEPPPTGRAPRATYGLITAATGGGLVITGLVFGQLARSRWQSAEDRCEGHICSNADTLNDGLVDAARTRADISTALVIGGTAAIGVGAFLYFTAPSRTARSTPTALRLTPTAGPGAVSLTLDGRF
jgi:hypothetical protein